LYIRAKADAELADELVPYWQEAGVVAADYKHEYLEAIAALEKERLKKLSEIGERTRYFFFEPEYDGSLLVWKKSTAEATKTILAELKELLSGIEEAKFNKSDLETGIKQFITDKGYDNGSVLWPMRAALTGMQFSPPPFEVAATLALGKGKGSVVERIEKAVGKL
jgi:glutamyl/glutaminyl-tRNA synthetase